MNEPVAASPQPSNTPWRRLPVITAVLAGLLLVAGVVTLIVGPSSESSFGWFAYAPLSDGVFAPGMHFLTTAQILGWTFIAGAACATAFWAGLAVARRRR